MIDQISLQILKILQEKARIPNVDVSRKVGLAPSAVLERVKKLEKRGIIDGYEVRLNPDKFNRSQLAFTHIFTNPECTRRVGQKLAALPEIQELHFVSGQDCFVTKIRCANNKELAEIIQSKLQTIPGVVSTKTETVLETIKETSRIPLPDQI